MELTIISGKSLICCVILKGVKHCSETETGINFTINSCGSSDNQEDFIENNFEHGKASFESLTGKGNCFPRSPNFMFKDKVVPCFTRWSECGGMCVF